jgi:branched-chain amino acid transport system permease protein
VAKFVEIIVSGIADGAISGLIALGIVLLFRATGVVNFAQGDLMTLGAYFGIWLLVDLKLPMAVAYILAILLSFSSGVVIERVGYAPLRRRPILSILIATFALSLLIEAILTHIFTNTPKTMPAAFSGHFHLFGAVVQYQDVLILVVTVVILCLVEGVLNWTTLGRQVRALSSDRDAALLQGIRASRLSMLMFGLSATVAGIAGLLIAPILAATPTLGFGLMLSSFAAVVIGGFDRPVGAVLAAIGVGILTQVAGGYVSSSWNTAWPYLILIGILIVKPEGIVKATVGVRY